jgi:hypothetical protein
MLRSMKMKVKAAAHRSEKLPPSSKDRPQGMLALWEQLGCLEPPGPVFVPDSPAAQRRRC